MVERCSERFSWAKSKDGNIRLMTRRRGIYCKGFQWSESTKQPRVRKVVSSSNQTCWSKMKLAIAAAFVTLLVDGILFHPVKFLLLVEIKFPSF